MRPQLACGNVSATWLTISHSIAGSPTHVSLVATKKNWQRWAMMHVVRCGLHPSKGRRGFTLSRFAALSSRNEAVELERVGLQGNLNNKEGAVEGLVSSVGTPAPSVVSFRDLYLADKQFVVLSFSAFVVCRFLHIPFLLPICVTISVLTNMLE